MLFVSCKQVQVIEAPDAGKKDCHPGPVVFCEPVPSSEPGCSTDDRSSKLLEQLPRATRYPPGCAINFVGPIDVAGDCTLAGICRCAGDKDGGTAQPAPSDAGANDGSLPETAPIRWTCYP
jgi:hypothetical protein